MELGDHFSGSRSTRRKAAKPFRLTGTPTAEDLVVAINPGAWMASLTRLNRPRTPLPIDFYVDMYRTDVFSPLPA